MKRLLFLGGFILASLTISASDLVSGQTYKIALGDNVLSLENSSLSDGAAVHVWTETNVNAQRWVLDADGDDTFIWRNAYSEYPLTNNGTAVCQSYTIGTATSWQMEAVEDTDNLYYIKHQSTGLYLEMQSSGNQATLTSQKTGTSATNQQWSIEAVEASPNHLTATYRDEMMADWKTRYYGTSSGGSYSWTEIQGSAGYWGHAEMFETILDAYETTGEKQYIEMFDELFAGFIFQEEWLFWTYEGKGGGSDWSWNGYNDDIAWV